MKSRSEDASMNKRMSDLIDAYRDAVSQRVAFNSPEHHAAETAAREALLGQSQAVTFEVSDDELAAWARNWHWNDTAADMPVDPSIYFRDMRMLKAFIERGIARSPQVTEQ